MKRNWLYTFAAIAAVVLISITVWSISSMLDFRASAERTYQRCFTEMTQYVGDLETTLLKTRIVADPKQQIYLAGELYRQAAAAKSDLGQIPTSSVQLDNMEKFLSQVGDFAYSVSMRLLGGGTITPEENQTLEDLSGYASKFTQSLEKLSDEMYDGRVHFACSNPFARLTGRATVAMASELGEVEKEFQDYPSLVYDGPFSQHLDNQKPKFIEGKNEVSAEDAVRKMRSLFPAYAFEQTGEVGGNVPSWYLSANYDEGVISAEITKQGGELLWFLNDRKLSRAQISPDDARAIAADYLAANGYGKMAESYYTVDDSSIIINFAAVLGDYVLYPDLVKVKVALDNGDVIGLEARGYIVNHTTREIPDEIYSVGDALSEVREGLSIDSVTRALIPLDGGREVACYQIKGTIADKNFLVYLNTQTGDEEKIMILIEDENGTLAV